MNSKEVTSLTIALDKSIAEYSFGETISGTAAWTALPKKTKKLSIRLIWYTNGKGDRDVDVVSSLDFEITTELRGSGEQIFEFVAPHRPCSFAGTLIELTWAIELIAYPSKDSVLETLVIGSEGKTTLLKQSYELVDKWFVGQKSAGFERG